VLHSVLMEGIRIRRDGRCHHFPCRDGVDVNAIAKVSKSIQRSLMEEAPEGATVASGHLQQISGTALRSTDFL
jgi:hypothetical protein